MENQDYKREIELRSEKVRSIVGKVPPTLIRYGIMIIALVIFIFLIIIGYLPYKQEFTGKAVVYDIPISTKDSVNVVVELELPDTNNYHLLINKKIKLSTEGFECSGYIVEYSTQRKANGMNRSVLRMLNKQLPRIQQSQVNYRLTIIETTMLKKILYLY